MEYIKLSNDFLWKDLFFAAYFKGVALIVVSLKDTAKLLNAVNGGKKLNIAWKGSAYRIVVVLGPSQRPLRSNT